MIGIVCNKYICSFFYFIPIFLIACLISFLFFYILKQNDSVNSEIFLIVILFFLFLGYLLPSYYTIHNQLPRQVQRNPVSILGRIEKVIDKSKYQEIYLTDVLVNSGNKQFPLIRILIQETSKEECLIGNTIVVKGEVSEFDKATNPGQFDSRTYYEAVGIRYRVWDGKIIRQNKGNSLLYPLLEKVKQKISFTYHTVFSKEDSMILHAMVLGDKSELSIEVKELYQKAGISHILAISGLHVSLIGLLLFRLLKKAGIHHNMASILCMVLVYLYGIMTGFSVSTNRAVLMMCISLAACLVKRTYDSISAICVSGFCILLMQPYQLFQSSFQLSFLAVFGAVWFVPIWKEYIKWLFPDFEKRMEEKENSEYHSVSVWVNQCTRLFRTSLLASCCIQCITLPVLLCNFYEVAIYAPVLNLFILPLASFLMILAVLIGVLGSFWIPIGYFLSGAVHVILLFYAFVCKLFEHVPMHVILTGCPRLFQVIGFVMLIGMFCVAVRYQIHKACGILILFAIIFLCFKIPASGLQITMLDVGQGDSIFVEERGMTLLIDGGSSSVKQVGKYRIYPFLKYSGVKRLEYCFLTHMDADHINGITELMEMSKESGEMLIRNLVLPNLKQTDEAFDKMVALAKSIGVQVVYLERGQRLKAGKLELKCLHPSAKWIGEDRNSASLVMELNYERFHMLLTGDVDAKGENAILENQNSLQKTYDILKVAHHGSKYSSAEEWLSRIHPRIGLISCGKGNRYGHPHQELLARMKEKNITVKRTDEEGAIRVVVHKKGYRIS